MQPEPAFLHRSARASLANSPNRTPRRAPRRPADRLAEALLALAQGMGCITSHKETGWASITFAGTRHRFALVFSGAEAMDAAECFIAFLPDHEFAIPGQLVADAAVLEVEHQLDSPRMAITCELLLLEEG